MISIARAPWLSALAIHLTWQLAFWSCYAWVVTWPSVIASLPLIIVVASFSLGGVALALLPLTAFARNQAVGALFLIFIGIDAWMTQAAGPDMMFLRYANQYLAVALAAAFVQTLAGRPRNVFVALACAYLTVLAILALATVRDALAQVVPLLDTAATLALTLYIVWALAAMMRLQPDVAIRLLGVLMLGIVAMFIDIAANQGLFAAMPLPATMLYPPFLIIGVTMELALHGFAIHRDVVDLAGLLHARVDEQGKTLSETERQLREQAKLVAIAAERQRLMRDMHDGIGGQLTGLLLRLRREEVPTEEVRAEVQGAMDDLRHIIDAIDVCEEGLDVSLAIMRERLAPRLAQQGVALVWQDRARRPLPMLDSSQLVQLFRIIQEVATNTLKHAQARCLTIELGDRADGAVELVLSDDGAGFAITNADKQPRWRRGLANMHRRAALLGGTLSIASTVGAGTTVRLLLPQTGHAD